MADEPARQTLYEKTALNDRTRPKRESCLPSVYLIAVDRPHPLAIEIEDEYHRTPML